MMLDLKLTALEKSVIVERERAKIASEHSDSVLEAQEQIDARRRPKADFVMLRKVDGGLAQSKRRRRT